MIRLSATKVLVIESRSGSTIDKLPKNLEGLLAYTVDTSLAFQVNPIKLLPGPKGLFLREKPVGTLGIRDLLVGEGFKISHIGVDGLGNWLEVVPQ
jgi:hypothetical protein